MIQGGAQKGNKELLQIGKLQQQTECIAGGNMIVLIVILSFESRYGVELGFGFNAEGCKAKCRVNVNRNNEYLITV